METILLDETTKPDLLNKLLEPLGYYIEGKHGNWWINSTSGIPVMWSSEFEYIEMVATELIRGENEV